MDGLTDIKLLGTDEAREHAGTLDTGANYFQSLVAELENAKKEITANWQGDTTDIADINNRIDAVTLTFKDKVIPSLQQLSGSIVDYADKIDQNANHDVDNGTPTIPEGDNDYTTPTTPIDNNNQGSNTENATDNATSSGGGAGNIAGGVLTGAGIGAAVGSIIPGVGTAIGAGVGAAVGGISGGFGAALDSENTFEDGFWAKHGDNFADAWTSRDWTDNWDYSECEGLIDGLGQTVDGLVGTVTDLGGALIDTVGAAGNFLIDGAGELLGGFFSLFG